METSLPHKLLKKLRRVNGLLMRCKLKIRNNNLLLCNRLKLKRETLNVLNWNLNDTRLMLIMLQKSESLRLVLSDFRKILMQTTMVQLTLWNYKTKKKRQLLTGHLNNKECFLTMNPNADNLKWIS